MLPDHFSIFPRAPQAASAREIGSPTPLAAATGPRIAELPVIIGSKFGSTDDSNAPIMPIPDFLPLSKLPIVSPRAPLTGPNFPCAVLPFCPLKASRSVLSVPAMSLTTWSVCVVAGVEAGGVGLRVCKNAKTCCSTACRPACGAVGSVGVSCCQ